MSASSSRKTNVVALLAVVIVSAATMVALFWFFPLTTALVTLGLFAILGISARLARAIDVTDIVEVERGGPGV